MSTSIHEDKTIGFQKGYVFCAADVQQDICIEALNAWFLMNDKPPIAFGDTGDAEEMRLRGILEGFFCGIWRGTAENAL